MRRMAAIVLVIALAGCASRAWIKPGATRDSFNQASYACERDVRAARNIDDLGNGGLRGIYGRCMQAAGWAAVPPGQGFQTTTPP